MCGGQQGPPAPRPKATHPALPPAYLDVGGADWEGREGDPCPPGSTARWRLRMQRGSQPKGPVERLCPLDPTRIGFQGQKGAVAGCSGPRCRGHSQPGAALPYCSPPDGSLDCSVPILCPPDSTVYPFGACLLPPPGSQSTTRPQARLEIRWRPAQNPLWAKRTR